MEKLIFVMKAKKKAHAGKYGNQIRVSQDVYDKVKEISKGTGLTLKETADRLLLYALAESEIVEE